MGIDCTCQPAYRICATQLAVDMREVLPCIDAHALCITSFKIYLRWCMQRLKTAVFCWYRMTIMQETAVLSLTNTRRYILS